MQATDASGTCPDLVCCPGGVLPCIRSSEIVDFWSGTPPVETTTSQNKNARKISQNFRGNPQKLRRILQMTTKYSANFERLLRKFVEICSRVLRNLWGFPGKFGEIVRAFLFRLVVVSTGGVLLGSYVARPVLTGPVLTRNCAGFANFGRFWGKTTNVVNCWQIFG